MENKMVTPLENKVFFANKEMIVPKIIQRASKSSFQLRF